MGSGLHNIHSPQDVAGTISQVLLEELSEGDGQPVLVAVSPRVRQGPSLVSRICQQPQCGRSFQVRASRLRDPRRGIYCSRACLSRTNINKLNARRPPVGPNNPNFKGWRSRDQRAYVDRFRAKYPEKASAHDLVRQALQKGLLVRPAACQRCGEHPGEPLHSHHEDYGQPLSVMFVCRPCHRVLDEARVDRVLRGAR